MNLQISALVDFFGSAIEQGKALEIKKNIIAKFRRPYVKKDMNTHGPLWSQYYSPQGIITSSDINPEVNVPGYIYAESKAKEAFVFKTTLNDFIKYLESREDGLYPAVYFVNDSFTFCLCENGERGSMKPIYLYKAGDE